MESRSPPIRVCSIPPIPLTDSSVLTQSVCLRLSFTTTEVNTKNETIPNHKQKQQQGCAHAKSAGRLGTMCALSVSGTVLSSTYFQF